MASSSTHWISKIGLAFLLVFVSCSLSLGTIVHESVMLREHIGAYFERKGQISAGSGHYKYIFKIEYPLYKTYAQLACRPTCDMQTSDWVHLNATNTEK